MVVRTQSVEFMPLPLTLACLASSLFWGLYGFVLWDYWILLPQTVGVTAGIAQVALWCYYYKPKQDATVQVETVAV